MYDTMPTWFFILVFCSLIAALILIKIGDYKRIQKLSKKVKSANSEIVFFTNTLAAQEAQRNAPPYISPTDTPIFDMAAAKKLSFENFKHLEESFK